MRTIKFKAISYPIKRWVIGDLIQSPNGTALILPIESLTIQGREAVNIETLCQFVGIANGFEVYEGDYDADGNMVYWCEEEFAWQFAQIDIPTGDIINCHSCEGNFLFLDHWNDFKPVGNIHDIIK